MRSVPWRCICCTFVPKQDTSLRVRVGHTHSVHTFELCLGVEYVLRLSFAYRPATLGTTLASATFSCSCSRICDLTCSSWRAIVTAFSRLRNMINYSFCLTDGSLMPITKRSRIISFASVYSQCIARVCKSLTNSSTVSDEFCVRS